jgi:hypothetical protein
MITQLLATWIPALLIALSGVMKLSGNPKLLEGMTTLGVGHQWLRSGEPASPAVPDAPDHSRREKPLPRRGGAPLVSS